MGDPNFNLPPSVHQPQQPIMPSSSQNLPKDRELEQAIRPPTQEQTQEKISKIISEELSEDGFDLSGIEDLSISLKEHVTRTSPESSEKVENVAEDAFEGLDGLDLNIAGDGQIGQLEGRNFMEELRNEARNISTEGLSREEAQKASIEIENIFKNNPKLKFRENAVEVGDNANKVVLMPKNKANDKIVDEYKRKNCRIVFVSDAQFKWLQKLPERIALIKAGLEEKKRKVEGNHSRDETISFGHNISHKARPDKIRSEEGLKREFDSLNNWKRSLQETLKKDLVLLNVRKQEVEKEKRANDKEREEILKNEIKKSEEKIAVTKELKWSQKFGPLSKLRYLPQMEVRKWVEHENNILLNSSSKL